MDEEQINSISEHIEKLCAANDTIAGSTIGFSLRDSFPYLNIKTQYGGLRRFIEKHLQKKVEFFGKKGGDDLFRHTSKEEVSDKELTLRIKLDHDMPWKAFVDPHFQRQLAVDSGTGKLLTFSQADPIPEGAIAVPKLTEHEHKSIAINFLSQVFPQSRPRFEKALRETDYWPHWKRALDYDRTVFIQWLGWRRKAILEIFDTRLLSQNLPSDVTSAAIDALGVIKPAATDALLNTKAKPSTPTPSKSSDRSLHDFAHAAINAMDEEELRRVWLPFGAIMDAFKSRF